VRQIEQRPVRLGAALLAQNRKHRLAHVLAPSHSILWGVAAPHPSLSAAIPPIAISRGPQVFCLSSSSQSDFVALSEMCGASIADGLQLLEGDNGRGVFANRAIRGGEQLMSIPLSSCFVVGRYGGMNLPGSAWEDLRDGKLAEWPLLDACTSGSAGAIFANLEWDLRMALAVSDMRQNRRERQPLQAGQAPAERETPLGGWTGMLSRLAGKQTQAKNLSSEPSSWLPIYSAMLPSKLCSPLAMPPHALKELHDEELAEKALAEQERVRQLLQSPGYSSVDGLDEQTLFWALGMAQSRSFDVTPDTFVMAPVVDLVNHAWKYPNAEVQVRLWGGEDPDSAVLQLMGHVVLTAVRDIPEGSEVLFSYGCNTMPTSELLLRYGMLRPGGNAFDVLPLASLSTQVAEKEAAEQREGEQSLEGDAAASHLNGAGEASRPCSRIDMQRMEAALKKAVEREGGRWLQAFSTDGYLKSALSSLAPLTAEPLVANSSNESEAQAREIETIRVLVATAEARLAAFPAGAEEQLAGAVTDADIATMVVAYREHRRRLWAKSTWVLQIYSLELGL